MSIFFALGTLKLIHEMQLGLAAMPLLLQATMQSRTTPPGTWPLGARCRESTILEVRGLQIDIEA
jgi:hypothetical protein